MKNILLSVLGVVLIAFALQSFLVPNQFLCAGITGIALLICEVFHLNLFFVFLLINLPFIIFAALRIKLQFAIRCLGAIVLFVLLMYWFPFPVITSDKLLVMIFGGFFLGLGFGICIRGGCTIDGAQLLAIKNLKYFTWFENILNAGFFGFIAWRYGVELAAYLMITYFVANYAMNYALILHKLNAKRIRSIKFYLSGFYNSSGSK